MARISQAVLASLLAVGALAQDAATVNAVNNCCGKLKRQFPDQVTYTNEPEFASRNTRWADTAELTPSCIFQPASVDDVSFAVKTLAGVGGGGGGPKCRSEGVMCPFSIKGGGHTPWAGGNNVEGGVAIVLDRMAQTVLSEDRSFVSLGGGAKWREAYAATNGSGVAIPGGRCPGTGVGGVATGGGYSWFIGQMGFSADNVINYEVVLASGEIVNANATSSHADLFMALKGGNNNFGVVTRFDVRALQHNQMVHGGFLSVPSNQSDYVLEQLQRFTDDDQGVTVSAGLTVEYFLNATTGEGNVLLWMIDNDAEGDHAFMEPFFAIEPKFANRVQTTLIADYPSNVPDVSRVLMADATFVNDLETIRGVHNITLDVMRTVSHIPNLTWDFQFEPLPRHIFEVSKARGGNVMGVTDSTEDLLVVFIMPLWTDERHDAEVYAAAERWHRAVKEYTASVGKGHPWEFANYAAPFQDVMGSYGAENLEFMREVSKKYDPRGVFQKAVKGGYKLWVE